ncbi:MAG: MBL fold metallo-hydrolase [Candidatus Eisenbacteria bacterium]|uniref:MBL fold metallo-hydrolase n=1 Tax=Eiseniibacteriota bacterium TaxID=2212470 RepID=A0A538TQK2_UNCEI|nr:MAG: MBL fold metallo-hydrolase [Candidatus Eisenbacteria bacterium]
MRSRSWLAVVLVSAAGAGYVAPTNAKLAIDPLLYPEPPRNAITFWGHACAYIDIGGFGIVTDPVFARRYAVIRRRLIAAPPRESFDQAEVVLISHAHQDHLNPKTLARFTPGTIVLCPRPAAKYVAGLGLRVLVMRPGDEFDFPGGTIVAVAAHHPGGRHSLKARSDGRALGYIIRGPRNTIYYSGDTDYFPGIAAIGSKYRPDIALLNINAHLHSEDAVFAIAGLGMPSVVPMHLGAYDGKSTRLGPRWRAELVGALGSTIVPLEVGESISLSPSARDSAAHR